MGRSTSMEVTAAHLGLAVAFVLAVVQTLRLRRERGRPARALRQRAARGRRGEREAERLVRRAGYRIVARQVEATISYRVDGRALAAVVRADLILSRGGRRFVAEVKTGDTAPEPQTAATRRQLLEYGHAFDAAEVLLVDPEARTIRSVGLPRRCPPSRSRLGPFLIGALAGAAALWWWLSA